MSEIKNLTKRIIEFRDARNWKQFHNPKDLAISLLLEASEVVEHFQWKNIEEMSDHCKDHKDDIGDELADVLYWVLLMSHDLEIDIVESFERKMNENEKKYSVEKSAGNHIKYNKLN